MAEGNTTTKWEVGWEDDTEWIVAVYKSMNTPDQAPLLGYKRISKSDYSERDIMECSIVEEFSLPTYHISPILLYLIPVKMLNL